MAAALEPLEVPAIFGSMEDGPGTGAGAAAEAWFSSHGRSLGHFVAGTWLTPPAREALECREAATGRPVATVPRGEGPDVAVAAATAAEAAGKWGELGGPQRGQHLDRLAQVLSASAPQLGAVSSLAGGHPLALTLGSDLDLGLRRLRMAGGWATLGPPGLNDWTPLGVVAVVIEGPCDLGTLLGTLGAILAMGGAAASAAGRAGGGRGQGGGGRSLRGGRGQGGAGRSQRVGGASAPRAPERGERGPAPRARAAAGSPRGHGGHGAGGAQVAVWGSPWGGPPRAVSPWGGPPHWGGPPWGGRVAVLVLDSADLDAAAAALAGGAGGAQLLVLVQEGALGALSRRLRFRLGGLRVGDPLHPNTSIGPLPLCPPTGTPHPQELLRAALDEGAEVFQPPLSGGGRFFPPTLITGVTPTSRCLREPFWGPLLPLLPVRSPPDAVTVTLGLGVTAASVWAQDVPAALDVADRLPLGHVWINALEGPEAAGEGLEALREFGRPPWDPPRAPHPPLEQESSSEPVTPPNDADVAAALQEARRAGWGRVPGPARAQVLRGAAAALGGVGAAGPPRGGSAGRVSGDDSGDVRGDVSGDDSDADGRLRAALLRWAARAELVGGAVQEVAGRGRVLRTRVPLGAVGVAWAGPRPLARALELLPPALALGNALVLLAPPGGTRAALRLRQALVTSGLPQGALSVLPGGRSGGGGAILSRHRPDGLWLCGGGQEPDWASLGDVTHVWAPGGGSWRGRGGTSPPALNLNLNFGAAAPGAFGCPGGAGFE